MRSYLDARNKQSSSLYIERGNLEELYTVSVMEGDTIVGHVPNEKSHVVWYFIEYDGVVICQVIDQ